MLYFSSAPLCATIRQHFIPLAIDCEQTERSRVDSPMTRLFWKVVKQRDRKQFIDRLPTTTQGFYVFGASGRLYGSANYEWLAEKPERLLRLLRQARAAHKETAHASTPRRPQTQHRPPPSGTLVARIYTRIRPVPRSAPRINQRVGYDYLWLSQAEVQALCRGKWPLTLTRRLTLCHLRDNVRGEPRPFPAAGIKRAEFRASAKVSGGKIVVALSGSFLLTAPRLVREQVEKATASGFEGQLEGKLVFDKARDRVERFLLHVSGTAWGRHVHTPGTPRGKYPLTIVAVLAGSPEQDPVAWRLPPYAAGYGRGSIQRYLTRGLPSR